MVPILTLPPGLAWFSLGLGLDLAWPGPTRDNGRKAYAPLSRASALVRGEDKAGH
jgi:hypothetical protein